jgi:hypothetical protein
LSKAISSFANMLQQLENFMAWHGMVCTEERANRVCRKMLLLLKTMLAFSHLPRKIVNTFVCKWLKGSSIDGKRNIDENVEEGVRFCSLSVGLQRPNKLHMLLQTISSCRWWWFSCILGFLHHSLEILSQVLCLQQSKQIGHQHWASETLGTVFVEDLEFYYISSRQRKSLLEISSGRRRQQGRILESAILGPASWHS